MSGGAPGDNDGEHSSRGPASRPAGRRDGDPGPSSPTPKLAMPLLNMTKVLNRQSTVNAPETSRRSRHLSAPASSSRKESFIGSILSRRTWDQLSTPSIVDAAPTSTTTATITPTPTTVRLVRPYVAFVVLFSIVVWSRSYQTVPVSWAAFLRGRFAPSTTRRAPDGSQRIAFDLISSVDAAWAFLQGTLASSLTPDSGQPVLAYEGSVLLGAILLYQVRAQLTPCAKGTFAVSQCMPTSLDSSTVSMLPFGASPDPGVRDAFLYRTMSFQGDINRNLLTPETPPLPGGYAVLLTNNATATRGTLAALRDATWIDMQTQSVRLRFALYNPTVNLLCAVALTIDTPADGSIRPHAEFRVVQPILYGGTPGDTAIACVEVAFLIALAYMAWVALQDARMLRWRVWRSTWVLVDIANIALFLGALAGRVIQVVCADELSRRLATDPYVDWQRYAYTVHVMHNVLGVNVLLTWSKSLVFIQRLSPSMRVLEQTVRGARLNLAALAVMAFIILAGFTQTFWMAFSTDIGEFATISASFLSLFSASVSRMEFSDDVRMENWLLGPVLLAVFAFLLALVVVNMFLAVVHGSYESVHQSMKAPNGVTSGTGTKPASAANRSRHSIKVNGSKSRRSRRMSPRAGVESLHLPAPGAQRLSLGDQAPTPALSDGHAGVLPGQIPSD
ncbi:Polycystin cation channel [Plasmodiophora brassicae]